MKMCHKMGRPYVTQENVSQNGQSYLHTIAHIKKWPTRSYTLFA